MQTFASDLEVEEYVSLDDMAWATRRYSKGQIDRAGATLLEPRTTGEELDGALAVVDNWRACHSYPLQAIKMTLRQRAKGVDSSALIAQRLKRIPSIITKLQQNKAMKLSQMQDIGGCRAVMPTIKDVRALTKLYEEAKAKNPKSGRPIEHGKDDYIQSPKPDGYRSYHLIFKYQSAAPEKQEFVGQRIEIQIRSRLQHAWATAVETVQTFTGQALKSKIKTGDPDWLRFFALMGSEIALRERQPPVPGTPPNRAELIREIRALAEKLYVEHSLRSWGFAVRHIAQEQERGKASAFLLVLDSHAKSLVVHSFKADELAQASKQYLQVEKETSEHPERQVVLVSVDSIDDLRTAYPNYFLDTTAFIEAMNFAIREKS